MSIKGRKPIPKTQREILDEQLGTSVNNPALSTRPSFPTSNRGNDVSTKGDRVKDISIGLEDIDGAILYYFENIIKPTVIQNGQRIAVPIIYSNQELWKAIQADGYYRDANSKIMAPLITFKRDNIEKNRNLGNKLDGNKVHLYQVFEKKYTKQK